MKKREIAEKPNSLATNNIILDDEMKILIRELVHKANEKGYRKSFFCKTVSEIWGEEIQAPVKICKQMIEDEKAFAEKIKKFWEYYEDAIFYAKYRSSKYREEKLIPKEDTDKRKWIYDLYYPELCSLYIAFQREDKLNQAIVIKYCKEYFGSCEGMISYIVSMLDKLFYEYMYFYEDQDMPEFKEDYSIGKTNIEYNQEFQQFRDQYEFAKIKINRVALAFVWFLERYF